MTDDKVEVANRIEFAQRLQKAKGDESARAFARRVGCSQNAMNQYLSGKSEPTRPVLEAIASACGVNLTWLITGEGPMYGQGRGIAEAAAHARFEIGGSNVVLVPFYEEMRASAGAGALVEAEASRPVAFSNQWLRETLQLNPVDLGMMRSKGDSMYPTVRDGELLMFDMSAEGKQLDDGIFILRLDGAILVKRLQRVPGDRVKIISDNGSYDPYVVDLNNGDDFAIIGRVVWKFGRI